MMDNTQADDGQTRFNSTTRHGPNASLSDGTTLGGFPPVLAESAG